MKYTEYRYYSDQERTPVLLRLATGALAGLLGSAIMSVFFNLAHRLLPRPQKYPLPPRLITQKVARWVGAKEAVDSEPEATLTTNLFHYGYGAASGAGYAALAGGLPAPAILKGILYGLGLWGVSYQGWLPALQVLPPATSQPRQRTILMIVAHLIYGAVTSLAASQILVITRKRR